MGGRNLEKDKARKNKSDFQDGLLKNSALFFN